MNLEKLIYRILPLICLLSILSLISFRFIHFGSENIVPFTNKKVRIGKYSDGHGEEFSKISYSIDQKKAVIFNYELTKEVEEPFVAIYFKNIDTNVFFKFDKLNTISIELEAKKATRIPITISNNKKGFTALNKLFTNIPFTTTIDLKKGKHSYNINLNEFKITSWWLRKHQFKDDDIPKMDLNRVNLIIIGSCQSIGPFDEDQVTISSLSVFHSNKTAYFLLVLSIMIFSLYWVILKKLKSRKKVMVPYHKIELAPEKKRNELEEIFEFIGLNYSNPELSLSAVETELSLPGKKISLLIKSNLDLSFKEYLNNIRLTEVKRLLIETDRPVSQIAYEVGYNNISHFNRVFKSYNNISPNEYRAQQ